MASNRELQMVRLACSRGWLTPEQGEDCLFLQRKLGHKLTLEEIFRRRRYLQPQQIAQLVDATEEKVSRRARPAPVAERRARPAPAPKIEAPIKPPPPARSSGLMPRDPRRLPKNAAEAAPEATPPPEVTRFEAVPGFVLEDQDTPATTSEVERTIIGPIPEAPVRLLGLQRFDDDDDRKTIIGMPDPALAELLQQARLRAQAEEDRNDATLMDGQFSAPVIDDANARTIALPAIRDEVESRPKAEEDHPWRVPVMPPRPPARPATGAWPADSPADRAARLQAQVRSVTRIALRPDLELRPEPEPPPEPTPAPEIEAEPLPLEGRFGPYEIQRIIAHGSRATVYSAEIAATGMKVALKVLTGRTEVAAAYLADHSEVFLAAARCASPHLVRVLDVGRCEGRYFVALQYIEGWTLGEKLEAGDPVRPLDALRIARDLAKGLEACAQEGLIHGDIQPDHVLMGPDDRALLFGIGFGGTFSLEGVQLRGTPGFVAPERLRGASESVAGDLYSVGAILHLLLSGFRPGEGPLPSDLPPAIGAAVGQFLAAEPSARPRPAQAAAALDALIRELVSTGYGGQEGVSAVKFRPLLLKASAVSAGLILLAVLVPMLATSLDVLPWTAPGVALRFSFGAASLLVLATALGATVALIRRGQIPLPASSAWLVRVTEGIGAAGSALLLSSWAISPPALLSLLVGGLGAVLLASWILGVLLRQGVAQARGGTGRILAILADPLLSQWRSLHLPLLVGLTALSSVRFAILAYFASPGA